MLSTSVGICSFRRTAELHNGIWRGHDLTYHFEEYRSHQTFGEPASPAVEQHQPLLLPSTTRQQAATVHDGTLPTPPAQQITCILPTIPPSVLTLPLSTAPISVRFIPTLATDLMLPSSFQGEGEGIHTSKEEGIRTSQEQPEAPSTNFTGTVLVRNPYYVPMTKSMTPTTH